MSSTRAAGKSKRIEARVTDHEKELVERAAAIAGRSITDFVVSSALEKAAETIRSHQIMTLSARDSEAFVNAILNPPAPTERQLAAVRRYRAFLHESQ
jgi:uncharacterized protein (DUF1778 family)